MLYIFMVVFLLTPFLLVAGLIAPNFLRKLYKRDFTRMQNLKIYSALFVVSFLCLAITLPETNTPPTAVSQTTNETALEELVPYQEEVSSVASGETYPVTRVIDGDTIEILINDEKKTVRYIGIDTPETVHPSKSVECFGSEASNKNKELVTGQSVRLEKDISDTDRYGRLLRYVYVGEVFVNEVLVAEGYASAYTYPPDVQFAEVFRVAEQSAREAKRGLWGGSCAQALVGADTTDETTFTTPSDSANNSPVSASATPGQCNIKGNISADDEKIFHVIGCQSYSKTIINEEAGERWFCSEQEALDAGWRKALNC